MRNGPGSSSSSIFLHPVVKGVTWIGSSQLDVSTLCRKKEVVEAYKSDPLICFDSALIQLKDILLGGQRLLQKDHKNITVNNLLIAHGTADAIASYKTSVYLAEKLSPLENIAHFEMETFSGLYHDLMFEPESDEVTSIYINWILIHLNKPK
ncbi:hypothetical protein DSO57_1009689 [Entomophthora muscae]|uniref:Uncharacterized protein n=1 Tax=Entomophthora muscae TaxID=34485 RepID=A0ACC2THA5_9FUNG|nr:hypothetical protein DSO57_1009689 [Entomophthora muscae]